MIIDCSLSSLAIPGFPELVPDFGTKKPDGQPITARENHHNVILPFTKQRPISVTETSSAVGIESNLVFDMPVAGVSLTLDNAAFRGCCVKVMNSSAGAVQVAYSSLRTKSIPAGKFTEFEFTGNGWVALSNQSDTGFSAYSTPFLIASDKRRLAVKAGTQINLSSGENERTFVAGQDAEIDVEALLDIGTIENGRDYYVFLCPDPAGFGTIFRVSLTKTAPQGFAADEVMLIGGFHTLCASAGTGLTYIMGGATKVHPLNDYIAGDILPYSVWCLNHRPFSEPEGMVYIPSLDFWCDIYLQSGSGVNTKSAYQSAITRSRQYVDFVEDQFCVRKELLDDGEFAAAMLGSNEQTAVLGSNEAGATGGGAGGRKDTANRRMISIYGVEEGCGSLWQWLRTTAAGGTDGAIYGQTADTPTYGYITMTQTAHGPYGQSGGKGSFWGLAGALLAGGYWGNAAICGSRSRFAHHARSSASTLVGGRGRSRPMRSVDLSYN